MCTPSRNRIAAHSPSGGQSMVVARVSGPRIVTMVRSASRVTTISRWPAATETKGPPPSLRPRHTRSMYGESDGRSWAETWVLTRKNVQKLPEVSLAWQALTG
jgi:hypothetical protein